MGVEPDLPPQAAPEAPAAPAAAQVERHKKSPLAVAGTLAAGAAAWFTAPPPPAPAPSAADVEPPDEYTDPISQEIMLDPVLLVETGQSYERSTLEMWFEECRQKDRPCTDPLTRKVLRHTTVVQNFSLKSLINSWAERHKISDLSTFSAAVGRQRTMARVPVDQLAALGLGDGGPGGSGGTGGGAGSGGGLGGSPRQGGSGGSPGRKLYPLLSIMRQGAEDGAAAEPSPTRPAAGAAVAAVAAAAAEGLGVYPSMHPGTSPPASRKSQADAALDALRSAAGGSGGGNRGAAAYHAWTLMQLAADAEGRRLLWEGNAIPLAVYMLGQAPPEEGAAALDAAKPALCGTLQRMAARDQDVAASIAQCGGVHALVQQLTAGAPERRMAGCSSLYFLGWQGASIRTAMYDALAQHAAASRLPPRPLMAFWRFWEQLAAQQAAQQAAQLAAGGDSPASPTCASLALGREGEWDALALLLHMLAEGAAGAGGGQQQLAALDATGTAIPAVLAYSAAQGADAAVQYAAARASALLAQLPANLPQMLDAVLRECQQAAAVAAAQAVGGGRDGSPGLGAAAGGGGQAAGEAMRLLWELSHSPGTGGTLPRAVALMQQQGGLLLPGLEAALDPEHGRTAASRWLAAGLVACLTYEPPSGAGAAAAGGAAAADGMRRLLASGPAAGALQRLLALLEPDVASAHPQAAQAAALAVANLAAFRGLGQAQAGDRPFMPEPSGGMKAKLTGLTNRLLQRPSPPGTPAGPSPHASGDHAAHLPVSDGSGDYSAAVERAEQGAGEPRAALLQHGAVPKLLRLVLHCSAAAAAADASAAAAARAPAAPMLAQPTPLAAPTAAQQAQAAAAAAAESATAQRAVLAAVLQAINNLCADPAVASRLQRWSRPNAETHQRLTAALMAAMSDGRLPSTSREHARLLLHTESGAPGQRHALACSLLPPPPRPAAYPSP